MRVTVSDIHNSYQLSNLISAGFLLVQPHILQTEGINGNTLTNEKLLFAFLRKETYLRIEQCHKLFQGESVI